MKRGLVVALIVVLLLMGLGVVMPPAASGQEAMGPGNGCRACVAVLVVVASCFLVAVRFVSLITEFFAALCHPSPLERPPRLAS